MLVTHIGYSVRLFLFPYVFNVLEQAEITGEAP